MASLGSIVSYTLIALLFPVAQYAIRLLSRSILVPFFVGILFVPLLRASVKWITKQRGNGAAEESSIYGLDHAILNLELPPRSMWMNMGYWEDGNTDFPTACSALLEKVLEAAGLLQRSSLAEPATKIVDTDAQSAAASTDTAASSSSTPGTVTTLARSQVRRKPVYITDIGIGCGDQSVHMLKHLSSSSSSSSSGDGSTVSFPPVRSYVGMTQDPRQARYAQAAVHWHVGEMTPVSSTGDDGRGPIRIFCGDAGDVRAWPPGFVDATKAHLADRAARRALLAAAAGRKIRGVPKTDRKETGRQSMSGDVDDSDGDDDDEDFEAWFLGLDSLYHLEPYRLPLFIYAHGVGAGVMAFDLLLPPLGDKNQSGQQLTWLQKALLWLVCQLTGTPWGNLMTPDQYRAQLVEAGYSDDNIEIVDISDRVFAGLVAYLGRRNLELGMIGRGLGAFHAAKWIFDWWARSGVVRGCIVVARP